VIQRDDHDDAKISTVFWINVMVAGAIFAVLVVVAPFVAREFYGHAIVGYMLIAYGAKLLWQNVYLIPNALMKRELRFKELSVIRISANFAEFAGKIGFAAAGFGIWCFVLAPLCRVAVTGVGTQLRRPWRPKLVLRIRDARDYLRFGLKTSASQIMFHFYTNVDYPIVGYYFGDVALGIYRIAYEVVLEPVRIISNVVVDVAFPTYAKLRHTRDLLIAQFVSFTKLNLITVTSYSAIVFVAAEDVLAVFFPDNFHDAATAIRILCAVAILRAVSFVVPPLLDGVGKPNRTFAYTLTAAITLPIAFMLGAVVLGDHVGYLSVPIAWAVGYPIAFMILIWLAVYTLQWTLFAYLRTVAGVMACSIGAGLAGLAAHVALGGQLSGSRLLVTTVVILLVNALLLAYTQGLSLRTASRALKGDPEPLSPSELEKPQITSGST
jgi:O-antigen/teichoic acid export membrane protein